MELGDLTRAIRGEARPVDRVLALLAGRQHGVVGRLQLLALGISEDAIDRRLRDGRLHRLHRGVYAVGHTVLTLHGRWKAAVLACGPGAVLSHHGAASLWGLRHSSGRKVDVTAARTRRGHRGITLHRPRHLDAADRTERDGIAVTTLARTLLDLAAVVSDRQTERAVEQADVQKLLDVRMVDETIARAPRHRGAPRLIRALAAARELVPVTRSELERMFLDFCREFGLPEPAMNLWVEGYEVDALFADQALIVELDGADVHATSAARERDPIRDADLQLAEYRLLRVTERRLRENPDALAAQIRALLGYPPATARRSSRSTSAYSGSTTSSST